MLILTSATKLAIIFSGIFLWVGMLTGVWKYYQIRNTELARAHYYVDIAHRSSLLYAAASLILAALSYFTSLSDSLSLFCVVANLFFFSMSILVYIIHGMLKDTTNQFKQPHKLGQWSIPRWCMTFLMLNLIIVELGATAVLLLGTILKFTS
ncbi:hypothetical protein MMO39_01220 [Acinetobacter modestus]|jgi:hypothetical protein|uniref:Integral membrane protein n=1 Tax=Acinetobacter modestus TaxID=1776740 RepID=N9LZQ4_9GAMM|nr:MULTISPECIES: hypothetical protein [Acinetobacter]ENX01803.1 hypothetical protein F900_01563 [Acinetobacter modestus]KKW79699.1 membrane protein [Acinetobacter sp. AG1]MCH7385925.1 hypothetical protein [Acinetobacter modestus]MCM1959246.1 hypothetical protein [Acinetobacter modestus]WAU72189.1 hypothetical protein O1450_08505 [Acinetobacter sp. TR11]